MNNLLGLILCLSILIAGIIGIVRFPKIMKAYRPFLYLIWVGCINEIVQCILMLKGSDSIINNLIYELPESLLMLWFFRNMGAFSKKKSFFYVMLSLFICTWIVESVNHNRSGGAFNSYFTIIYSFCLVLLSINSINTLVFKERAIIKSPAFLISVGTFIIFTYKCVFEIFWLSGVNASHTFNTYAYLVFVSLNLLINVIYTLAILWMRNRQPVPLYFV